MSRFAANPTIVREYLDDEHQDWVDIRAGLTWGQSLEVFNQTDGTSVNVRKATLVMQSIAIAGWGGPGFTDDAGAVPAVTIEALERLDPPTGARLSDLVLKHNPTIGQTQAPKAASARSAGSATSQPAADSSTPTRPA